MRIPVVVALLVCIWSATEASAQVSGPQPVPPAASEVVATAQDVPSLFVPAPEQQQIPFGDRVCPTQYQDPRDDTVLRLIRSVSSKITTVEGDRRVTRETAYGDYTLAVPNRYEVELGRALRIDCVSNTPIGVVVRFTEADR